MFAKLSKFTKWQLFSLKMVLACRFEFSRSLEHFFFTVGQNNFGNKIPLLSSSVVPLHLYNTVYIIYWKDNSSGSIFYTFAVVGKHILNQPILTSPKFCEPVFFTMMQRQYQPDTVKLNNMKYKLLKVFSYHTQLWKIWIRILLFVKVWC